MGDNVFRVGKRNFYFMVNLLVFKSLEGVFIIFVGKI